MSDPGSPGLADHTERTRTSPTPGGALGVRIYSFPA